MRSLHTLILATTLALGTASAALAQIAPDNSAPARHNKQWQQGQQAYQPRTPGGELNYNEWKKSDEAKTFDRSIYSGRGNQ